MADLGVFFFNLPRRFCTNGRIGGKKVSPKLHQKNLPMFPSPENSKEHSFADSLRDQFDALGGYSASNSCHQASTTTLGKGHGSITTLFGVCRPAKMGWRKVILSTEKSVRRRRRRKTKQKNHANKK